MKHLSTSATSFLRLARRGALLLALGAAGPAAWGQSFGPHIDYPTGSSIPYGVAVGDVDADGHLDIVSGGLGSVLVLPGLLPVGTFRTPGTAYPTGATSSSTGLALGDVNGDGRLDIVAANSPGTTLTGTNGQVVVLLNSATTPGTFLPAVAYAAGSAPRIIALGDVNGDGRPDLAVANYNQGTVSLLLNSAVSPGTFLPAVSYPTSSLSVSGVALGDVNGDGRLDLAVSNYNTGTAGILLNSATTPGTFLPVTTYAAAPGTGIFDIMLGDLNGDQRLDIAMPNTIDGTVHVLLNSTAAPGTFPTVTTYPSGGTRSGELALGDVNGDGRLDIVTSNIGTDNESVLLNSASTPGTFLPAVTFSTGVGSNPRVVVLKDVTGDGRLDMVTANYANATIGVLPNTGTYTPLATARPTAADLTLVPNPAHDAFTVTLPAGLLPTQAELLNALGQVVRRPAVGGASFRVETSGLAPGLYTLHVLAGGTALARRVVVE